MLVGFIARSSSVWTEDVIALLLSAGRRSWRNGGLGGPTVRGAAAVTHCTLTRARPWLPPKAALFLLFLKLLFSVCDREVIKGRHLWVYSRISECKARDWWCEFWGLRIWFAWYAQLRAGSSPPFPPPVISAHKSCSHLPCSCLWWILN
jgi:hypothetical protein